MLQPRCCPGPPMTSYRDARHGLRHEKNAASFATPGASLLILSSKECAESQRARAPTGATGPGGTASPHPEIQVPFSVQRGGYQFNAGGASSTRNKSICARRGVRRRCDATFVPSGNFGAHRTTRTPRGPPPGRQSRPTQPGAAGRTRVAGAGCCARAPRRGTLSGGAGQPRGGDGACAPPHRGGPFRCQHAFRSSPCRRTHHRRPAFPLGAPAPAAAFGGTAPSHPASMGKP